MDSWRLDWRWCVWGLCMLVVGALTGCAALPTYAVTLLPAECPLPVPDELEEGQTITCGYLQVPQDRALPDGGQVHLPYAKIHAESAHPQPDPLVYIVGGPGGSALAEFAEVYAWLRPLRRDRDVILYDQRGTLLAEPALECPQTGMLPNGADAEIAAARARVPEALHPVDANDVVVARCAEYLREQGIDLAAFDTATHARDLVDLVAALGYAQFNLLGTSYGTRVALEVMRLDPVGLRAVVLDSVYPPNINAYEVPHALHSYAALQRVLAACAADGACAAAYPDLAARLTRVRDALNQAPLTLPLDWLPTLDGDGLLQLLLTRLDHALLPYVPQLVDEVARGETVLLVAILRGEVPPMAPPRAAPVSAADEARVTDFVLALNGAFMAQQAKLDVLVQREWLQLTARNADRARLQHFMEAHFPAAVAEPLLAQLAQLTDADLALVFAELRRVPLHPLTHAANLAVECRDEQPFNDYEVAMAAHRAVGMPDALVADELARVRHFWVQCALFPTGVADGRFNEAVESARPVLMLQGGLDTITPPEWAAVARATLTNAWYLEFPTQGHLVIQQASEAAPGCLLQILRDFLDAPQTRPDTTCVEAAAQFEWVLPEEMIVPGRGEDD